MGPVSGAVSISTEKTKMATVFQPPRGSFPASRTCSGFKASHAERITIWYNSTIRQMRIQARSHILFAFPGAHHSHLRLSKYRAKAAVREQRGSSRGLTPPRIGSASVRKCRNQAFSSTVFCHPAKYALAKRSQKVPAGLFDKLKY